MPASDHRFEIVGELARAVLSLSHLRCFGEPRRRSLEFGAGGGGNGRTCNGASSLVPPRECVFRADTEVRSHENHPGWRRVDQRKQQVAAFEAEHRSALEEVRHVSPKLTSDL